MSVFYFYYTIRLGSQEFLISTKVLQGEEISQGHTVILWKIQE